MLLQDEYRFNLQDLMWPMFCLLWMLGKAFSCVENITRHFIDYKNLSFNIMVNGITTKYIQSIMKTLFYLFYYIYSIWHNIQWMRYKENRGVAREPKDNGNVFQILGAHSHRHHHRYHHHRHHFHHYHHHHHHNHYHQSPLISTTTTATTNNHQQLHHKSNRSVFKSSLKLL